MTPKKVRTTSVLFAGKTYELDEYGYLKSMDSWDERFAEGIAPRVGIFGGLTDSHWKLIHYLRRRYEEASMVPLVINACIDNQLRLGKLKQLFPSGYHRGACKVAGLNYEFMARSNYLLTYENYSTLKAEYRLTDTGFLMNIDQWDERFALMVISEGKPGATLTVKHRQVIKFLQGHFRTSGNIPTVYETCKKNDIDLADLVELFTFGYRRGACRAAGLPFFG